MENHGRLQITYIFRLFCSARGGNATVVKILLDEGADVNTLDGCGRTPLDDAVDSQQTECIGLLESYGAIHGNRQKACATVELEGSTRRAINNMEIDFFDLQMISRIGAGAFGEIYKCRYVYMQGSKTSLKRKFHAFSHDFALIFVGGEER